MSPMIRRGITKVRWTKWGPIIYSSVSREFSPIVRAALHPVLDSEPHARGGLFPCRVVWAGPSDFYVAKSCRSRRGARDDSEFADDADAIAWLLKGER